MRENKVRENRVRRLAERQGYKISKSRRRDPLAWDFGSYGITGREGQVMARALNLDEVEAWLKGELGERANRPPRVTLGAGLDDSIPGCPACAYRVEIADYDAPASKCPVCGAPVTMVRLSAEEMADRRTASAA